MLKATKGAGTPEALFGGTGADGKGSKRQSLAPGMRDSITGSPPLARMMGHYGKNPPSYLADAGPTPSPTGHPAMSEVRGGSGGIKAHPKEGGIGPGPMGATGSATTYAKDPDTT